MAAAPVAIGLMVASQLAQGVSQHNALQAQAGVDRENARLTETQGEISAEEAARRARAVQGESIAALAGNGVALGTGSALDLLRQNAIEAETDILNRRYEAAGRAASLRTDANQKKAAARGALFGGVLRAGAAALTGMQDMGNADALDASSASLRAAQLQYPGGQRLPMGGN